MGTRKELFEISTDDRQFFDKIYEEHRSFMYSLARKYVDRQSDSEDIVQDAVERLLRNIKTLRNMPSYRLRKYIVLTIRTAYIDSERKKRRNNMICLDDISVEKIIKEANISTKISDDYSCYADLEKLKKELPERDWLLLEGKFIHGYSQSELEKIAGVSPDSIRMIICRAKRKARKILSSK